MYSIIYQFVTTQVLHALYRRYEKLTLFIVTDKPEKVYEQIKVCTNHGATLFKGLGFYHKKERSMVYSVVSSDELYLVIRKINEVDKEAFIDVLRSERIVGRFNDRPYEWEINVGMSALCAPILKDKMSIFCSDATNRDCSLHEHRYVVYAQLDIKFVL